MHHPTFSAEKAVYRSGTSYVSHGRNAVYRAEVVPAQAPVPLAGGEAGSIGEVAGGILGAWGCWESTCCAKWGRCCLPTPRGRRCWTCCVRSERCTRCIWPW
jgi:hypothetical protein